MKYKVGQTVRLHPLSYFEDNPNFVICSSDNTIEPKGRSNYYINKSMLKLLDKCFKIDVINYSNEPSYRFPNMNFCFVDWMIEDPLVTMINLLGNE